MQLRGLHHVTGICRDLEATIAFYRDVLGLGIVHDGPSDDDPGTRHVWFGPAGGAAGTLLSFMEYPQLPTGVVGVGSTHHFALVVESAEELEAWRDYLRGKESSAPTSTTAGRSGPCTCGIRTATWSRSLRGDRAFAPGPR